MPYKKPPLEQPNRFMYDGVMPKFWPPRTNFLWRLLLRPFQDYFAHHIWRVNEVHIEGLQEAFANFGPEDGVLIAPNHSHEGDAHVLLEAGRRLKSRFFFMAAWQTFVKHKGLDGWVLQRMGAFSVDREGTDRRSLRYAIDLLARGRRVVIFPEGEIHHLNERLKPLLEGVAFMAVSAQKQLRKDQKAGKVWIVPAAIKYEFIDDVQPAMEAAMKKLEQRLFWWKPKPEATMAERIIGYGEALLTLKEKEKLGETYDKEGDLSVRIEKFVNVLLERHERAYFEKSSPDKTVSLRIKALRRKAIELWLDEKGTEDERLLARTALDDIQLALQLSSYPGDYIRQNPSPERMAETLEKYMEDVFGEHHSLGDRRAVLRFAPAINIAEYLDSEAKSLVTTITDDLERAIQELMLR